ncbi:ROK family transcriptional regulator [Amycolatopsis keratiniphila]|uniref:ROK family transcriptional regulator n=1 Tax=Amycolatopsis keratiniphila TaxID=129921 RepID=UPI00087CD690|nr:ROK family transcriptional regulator [Amycolatopsis keratiniphila]OLZ59980.1 sugar kinase [Amycolatopsis keratiniphila subsp. nogabecina]SDU56694.1 Sugar kinase of the NBD/HSP70 family, may contain an N-terminal HTH domain [Amycolatopsis keratiniphila]
MPETGVNLRGLRQHNRTLLLTHILRAGGLSRVELAERTRLTQQAVSKIVPELLEAGLLDEERQPATGVGKPRTLLRVRADARHALGAQLDRDSFRVVMTDLTGKIIASRGGPLIPGFTPAEAVSALGEAAEALLDGVEGVLGLGVGSVGPLDHHEGVVRDATNMPGWHDVPLRDLLAERTGLPVRLDKNTNAAAFAQHWPEGDQAATAVVLVGTGIGVGLLIDGRLYRGPRTNAGEFGHTTLAFDGPRCACGRRGCVEVLHNAAATTEEAAGLLAIGLADLVQVLDLERVVLTGRSVRAAPGVYRDTVAARLRELLPLPHWQRIQVDLDEMGDDVVAFGAAAEVLAGFYESGDIT